MSLIVWTITMHQIVKLQLRLWLQLCNCNFYSTTSWGTCQMCSRPVQWNNDQTEWSSSICAEAEGFRCLGYWFQDCAGLWKFGSVEFQQIETIRYIFGLRLHATLTLPKRKYNFTISKLIIAVTPRPRLWSSRQRLIKEIKCTRDLDLKNNKSEEGFVENRSIIHWPVVDIQGVIAWKIQ